MVKICKLCNERIWFWQKKNFYKKFSDGTIGGLCHFRCIGNKLARLAGMIPIW